MWDEPTVNSTLCIRFFDISTPVGFLWLLEFSFCITYKLLEVPTHFVMKEKICRTIIFIIYYLFSLTKIPETLYNVLPLRSICF